MKLSSRSRYGFRAILELAVGYGEGPIRIKTIAAKEDISNKYLEQLMAMLKSTGLIRSVRGPRGGYSLSRPPDQIRLREIFVSLEGPLTTTECLEHPDYCPRCTDCVTRQIWAQIHDAIMGVLDSMSLQDLVDKTNGVDKGDNYQI